MAVSKRTESSNSTPEGLREKPAKLDSLFEQAAIYPFVKPSMGRDVPNQVISKMEGMALYDLGFLYREKADAGNSEWRILAAMPDTDFHCEAGRLQFLREVIARAQDQINTGQYDIAIKPEENGEMVVSCPGFDKRDGVTLPASTLLMSTLFLRALAQQWPATGRLLEKYQSFGSFWVGVEGINRLRLMQTPRTIRAYRQGGAYENTPILISDCCDPRTHRPLIKLDDTFYFKTHRELLQ